MANSKKKSSAKRSAKPAKKVQYAAKNQTARAQTATAQATRSAQKGAEWVKSSASQWQKGANDWAKQSAKLYQLPFGQADASEVAKNAAAQMQSATEGMMKMGTDFAQQMFSQGKKGGFNTEAFNPSAMFKNAPSFNPQDAQEKMSRFARESAEHLNKSAGTAQQALNETMELTRENGEVLVEVTNTAVSVSKELGAEWVSYLNKTFSQNVELSKQVLTCRTLNDLFDLSSRFMKTNFDSFFSESIKLSEKLFRVATEVSEPLNERVSETTERLSKAIAA